MAIEDVILRYVASAAGVPAPLVAQIEKEVPALARICRNAKLLSPIVNEATPIIKKLIPKLQAIGDAPVKEALPMLGDLAPLIDQLKPLYGQAMAIVGPEEGDFEEVAPVFMQLMEFFSKKYPTTLGSGVE